MEHDEKSHVSGSDRRAGVVDREQEENQLLIEIPVEVIDEQAQTFSSLRGQPGTSGESWEKKARDPDESNMEDDDPEILEIPGPDPHDRQTKEQGIRAMQPPEQNLVPLHERHRTLHQACRCGFNACSAGSGCHVRILRFAGCLGLV